MSAEDRAVGAPEHLHPLFILTGLGSSLRGLAGGYAFIAYLAVSGRAGTAVIVGLVLLLFMLASLLLYWMRFQYRVGDDEIRIDSGILSRTHRSIPFDRIQDVDISQGPLARIAGLARVKFETGGSAGADEDEGVLQAITLERAEQLRSVVRAHRSSAAPQADPAGAAQSEQAAVYALDLKRLLLAGLFNFSLALFAGLFGATQTFGQVAGFDPLSRPFWVSLLQAGDPLADFILAHQLAAALAGIALLLLAGLLTGIVRTLLRDYGFRLGRTEAGLRRRRGLLTRTDVTLPIKRAQAAIVATGPVRDLFGWRELKLQSLARDEGGSGDHVLAPLATEQEIAAVLSQLEWRPLGDLIDWRRVSPAYVWTLALGMSPLLLLAALQVAYSPLVSAALAGFVAIAVLARALAWRRTRFALDADRLLIATGWWRRRLVILPCSRIQSIDLTENFVSRWFGTASLAFGVAGGGGFSGHRIPSLRHQTARDLRQQLLVSRA